MMALFAWGRVRYDVVAMLALFTAVVVGIVPAQVAFTGFGDDVVIIVAAALVVSAAVARSGAMEQVMRPVAPYLTSVRLQVFALVLAVIVLSTFIKNVGALAIMMPVAFQLAKKSETSPSQLLMPLAFGSLVGGLITLVGTSPNVVVARVRQELTGRPFEMFDYAPVGLTIAFFALVCLTFTYRLLPRDRRGGVSLEAAINITDYVVEARVTRDSSVLGQSVADTDAHGAGDARVIAIVRDRFRYPKPPAGLKLQEGDRVMLEGEPEALERIVVTGGLELAGQDHSTMDLTDPDVTGVVEGVVTGDSVMVGQTPSQLRLSERHELQLLALSRSGQRITSRLKSIAFRPGDVAVLQGNLEAMPDTLRGLGVLPLAERELALGRTRRPWLPVLITAVAVLAIAFKFATVPVAFFGAVLALLLTKALSLREAYEAIDWPIIVLLGSLIPVSEAMRTTGVTELIAAWLAAGTEQLPAIGSLALIMIVAMAVTPFLNNAATVLMMAPVAAGLAGKLGLNADPFLMAVAVGSACDFLTPFGHQCNTLVMGPGGYKFGDYARLGLPLSTIVLIVGVPAIALFWPFS
jgi:di/tricarboxylate transporter